MCWWGWVEVSVLFVQMVALVGLFYLNHKNRKLAEKGVAGVLESLSSMHSVEENAALISRVVDTAIAEPGPGIVPNPPPTKESDLDKRVDK